MHGPNWFPTSQMWQGSLLFILEPFNEAVTLQQVLISNRYWTEYYFSILTFIPCWFPVIIKHGNQIYYTRSYLINSAALRVSFPKSQY